MYGKGERGDELLEQLQLPTVGGRAGIRSSLET